MILVQSELTRLHTNNFIPVVLYQTAEGSSTYAKAKIVDVHLDLPDPPFYTITYMKYDDDVEDFSAPSRRPSGNFSGSGAQLRSPPQPRGPAKAPTQARRLMQHEKQTTEKRLKKRVAN